MVELVVLPSLVSSGPVILRTDWLTNYLQPLASKTTLLDTFWPLMAPVVEINN